MVISFLRTLILYILVVAALRVMGKRQIGELQPSELVVAIMISDLASIPVSDIAIPLLSGIIPIITLIIFEVVISFVTLKSEKMRNLISGRPATLIKNGVIQQEEMRKMRYNMEDLLEELRIKGMINIADVDTAIMETNGELTIIPKSDKRSVTTGDLNLAVPQDKLPYILISDGKIRFEHLRESGFDIHWLNAQLKKYNLEKPSDVFVFSVDSQQNVTIQVKSKAG